MYLRWIGATGDLNTQVHRIVVVLIPNSLHRYRQWFLTIHIDDEETHFRSWRPWVVSYPDTARLTVENAVTIEIVAWVAFIRPD